MHTHGTLLREIWILLLKSEGKSSHKTRSYKTDMTSLVCICPFHFKKGHSVAQCRMFKRLSPSERFKLMEEKGLCFTCFGKHLRKIVKLPSAVKSVDVKVTITPCCVKSIQGKAVSGKPRLQVRYKILAQSRPQRQQR